MDPHCAASSDQHNRTDCESRQQMWLLPLGDHGCITGKHFDSIIEHRWCLGEFAVETFLSWDYEQFPEFKVEGDCFRSAFLEHESSATKDSLEGLTGCIEGRREAVWFQQIGDTAFDIGLIKWYAWPMTIQFVSGDAEFENQCEVFNEHRKLLVFDEWKLIGREWSSRHAVHQQYSGSCDSAA